MARKAKKADAARLFINRELSWLEFNDRVLREGLCESLPLLERVKFLAIVSSNLDEFFMIRVAGLVQQRAAGVRKRDISGMTPVQQLRAIAERVHRMTSEQTAGVREVLSLLAEQGLAVLDPPDWAPKQRRFLRSYFAAEVLPALTPLAVQELSPCPVLPGLQLNVAAVLSQRLDDGSPKIVVIPVPVGFPRFVTIRGDEGLSLARLEDIIAENCDQLLGEADVRRTAVFRVTRDADVAIDDDDAGDLLQAVEHAVLTRRRRGAVRLEISAHADAHLRHWLVDRLRLRPEEVYEIDGMLDAAALMEIAGRSGFDHLKSPDWPSQPPQDLLGEDDLYEALRDHDAMLFHPYERFEPVMQMVSQAAGDPDVLAIKQTLYRTSGESPIIGALERAAENGKQVTVLVELKARFDEARNVGWARQLEEAGCHVIYGIAGLKTHAKALLIVRREGGRIERYVHLATGNYHDKTAKLYSDIGLMTTDRAIASDVAAFFNLLTGYSEPVGFSKLALAPTELRQRFEELIEREIRTSTREEPGLIMAKVNSLHDRGIAEALYRAAQAGVRVRLNVRGICCLRPGLKGVSENVEVRSIVDRFLEHARIFYFRNGGHEETYLSSADWMTRNLDKRLELLVPVKEANLRRRLVGILDTFFADNVKARRLLPDGTYEPVPREGPPLRAQEKLYADAVEAARAARPTPRFRPLTRPAD
jgi:polyphosphate kinase